MSKKDMMLLARRYALQNAVHHGGEALAGTVLGRILAAEPGLKKNVKELREIVDNAVDEINAITPDEQKKLMEELEEPIIPEHKKEEGGLAGLPGARHGAVVVRFAPNPDGAIHLGNARPAILNDEYTKRYDGTFILRFDDTDPKVKIPEKKYYEWIRDDLKWLGIDVHKEIIASSRLDLYKSYAVKMIEENAAYVCTCDTEKWKKMRDNGKPCVCRGLTAKKNLELWGKMVSREFKEGEAVLRMKTSLKNRNPAVRDWPAFRIVDNPKHPFVKSHLWPLFNFASAVDDHELGVTHIIRGQEHATNETKQRYMYKALGWEYPHVKVVGRLSIGADKTAGGRSSEPLVMSKSLIRKGIDNGEFKGWDDPKLATIQSLARRGFQPDTLRRIIINFGASSSDGIVASENLAAYNRKVVDGIAKRFFFVAEPVQISLDAVPIKTAKLKLHPEEDMGFRMIETSKNIFVEKADLDKFHRKEVRLMGFCNAILERECRVTTIENKDVPKIHWLPAAGNLDATVIMPDKELHGFAENGVAEFAKKGDVVQFERFGFCRIENIGSGKVTAVFGHK